MKALSALSLSALFALTIALTTATPARADSQAAATGVHVKVTLAEMKITVDTATVPAGPVTFDITNAGMVEHELVLLDTDIAANALPAGDEPGKAAEVGHVTEIDPVAKGTTASLTATLAPGNYVIVCNKPGHYAAGMFAAFTVSTPVAVGLKEMVLAPSQKFMHAGAVSFTITNTGTTTHEMVVVKTDVPDGQIAADPSSPGQVLETGSQGEADDIDAGKTATLSLVLPPGHYAFICNKPGHYLAGMHTTFTVLPGLTRTQTAAIDMQRAKDGLDLAGEQALVNTAALLKAPGVVVTDLDRAAVAAGILPRAVASDGTLEY